MTSFSKDEMVRIVLFYGKFENYQKVRNEYAKFYGISKHPQDLPDVRMFKSVIDRFLGTGSVHKKGAGGRPKAARTEENEEKSLEWIRDLFGPRVISRLTDIP